MRRILALSFSLLLAVLLISRGAEWWSEKWWFAALDQGATWATYMKWRAAAFVVAAPLWLAIVGLNLRLAWQQSLALREPLSLLGGPMEGIAVAPTPALRLGRAIARATVWGSAWLAALAASNRFDLWLLLGQSANEGSHLGFFLFRLPALSWFVGWLGLALGLAFFGCLVIYFWLEAIETGPGVFRASELARQHLALLGALLIAWKGADSALKVVGAQVIYGDSVQGLLGVPEQLVGLPVAQCFAWSALPVAAIVFWLGARDNGRGALLLSVFWLAMASVTPALAPAFARSLGVGDDAAQRQIIADHIAATRLAWGFESVEEIVIAGQASFAETVLPAPGQVAPVVLWPLESARATLPSGKMPMHTARLHVVRQADNLQLHAIATDRAERGDAPALQQQAPAATNAPIEWTTPRALDSILLSESPPAPQPSSNRLGQPPTEVAPLPPLPPYRLTTQTQFAIERASLGAGLALATRFFDASLIAPGPPLMLHLDPVARARNLAPFVNWEGAVAHPLVLESGVGPQVYWIVEGCFTARTAPNSATLPGAETWGNVNYARQNVTAVFNGTTGESNLYLFDPNEPISRAWNRALPTLFRPIEEMPAPIRAAIRPSPAYLSAVTRIYARYHATPDDPKAGDERRQWATRTSSWRALFSPMSSTGSAWNEALLPDAAGQKTLWQLAAFAPSRGRMESGDQRATLTAIAGVSLSADGNLRWRQWRPELPLPLPDLATPTQAVINEGGVKFAPPMRVGAFPTFDPTGRAQGFTVFRAEMQNGDKGTPPSLLVQAQTTGPLALAPLQTAPLSQSLSRARQLWSAILAARRAADWPRVEQLEQQLSRLLNQPTPPTQPPPSAP